MSIKDYLGAKVADFATGGAFSRIMEVAEIGFQGQAYFREAYWDLEAALRQQDKDPNSPGWAVLGAGGEDDFSRKGLRMMHRFAVLMALKNPLIKRGVKIQSQYVFGQGVSVDVEEDTAKAAWGDFWDDEMNRREWTSPTRLAQLERKLQIKGNLFALFFVDKVYGTVQVREVDVDEIEEVIPDPDDGAKPAYYKRVFNRKVYDPTTGKTVDKAVTEIYPDWHYQPRNGIKWKTIAGATVFWDRPMAHFARERINKIGIAPSEIYAQLDWGKGYTEFLSDRKTVARALSRIVSKFTSATKKGVQKSAEKTQTTYAGTKATGRPDVGGEAHLKEGSNVEAVNVKGATIHPDEGRRLLLMVCAGFGFGETFFGDVSVGTLATAESLDQPTRLAMMECQSFWKDVLQQMARFVILQAARAPMNPLSRVATVLRKLGRDVVEVAGKAIGINVDFPPITSDAPYERMKAIDLGAKYLRTLPKLLARLTLSALGADDMEDSLALLPDDVKITKWPEPPPTVAPSSDEQLPLEK